MTLRTLVLLVSTNALLAVRVLPAAEPVGPPAELTAEQQAILAAVKTSAVPQFSGPAITGIRTGTPFLFSLAATGDRPIQFSARHLPRGLKLDRATGIITGTVKKAGTYNVAVAAANAKGQSSGALRIVVGDTLALTPPMGWNSYDAFGDCVVESEVLANAAWLNQHLQPVGWDTVVVDFRWYDSKADGIRVQNPEGVTIDEFGRCTPPTNRFPSAADGLGFKTLADRIHAMGLKFGIHIMRGIPRKAVAADSPIAGSSFKASQAALPEGDPNRTCNWNRDMYGVDGDSAAGKAWYASIARQYAEWGVDYIKCDDMSFLSRGRMYGDAEIEALSRSLRASGRSIILSLSPGPTPVSCSQHVKEFANLWRISGDFWDRWGSLSNNFELFASWMPDNAPGHWADGDMIPFAHVCQRNCDVRPDHWTHFTPDEELTLMSLWALTPSPLMLGMNLPDNDAWTTAIISNPEVLAVNQDWGGHAARRLAGPPGRGARAQAAESWIRELSDGSCAVGFFNRGDQSAAIDIPWRRFGYAHAPAVRDLWLHKDLPTADKFTAEIPPHGCVLLRVRLAVTPAAIAK